MTMRGLVLITVCLANVLAARAECCKCDCQHSGLHQSQLYYLPIASQHLTAADHGIYQIAQNLQVPSVGHFTQTSHDTGYQSTHTPQIHTQYRIAQAEIENSLDSGNKLGGNLGSLSLHASQQPSLHYREQESLNSVSATSTDKFQQEGIQKESEQLSLNYGGDGLSDSAGSSASLGQKHVSKVSSHQGNHYIKIEQHVSPHKSSSTEDGKEEHDKDHGHHHHGKDDYYKFEYGVNDQHTHDIKSHKEEKKGDVVQGEYSLVEDTGNVRTVKYYADWKTGFHAQVHNSKTAALG